MAPWSSTLVVLTVFATGSCQDDGNPHNWDRKRRCDHAGYTPKCGACEGIGGIAKSDEAADIKIPLCDAVEPSAPGKRPVWGKSFTETKSHEVLIGTKNDPACFAAFPGNSSVGAHCYKPQECVVTVDFVEKQAMRVDSNQAGNAWGIFGNVTSTIYHQGRNMWIINHLPLGITQTICTAPREGSDPAKPSIWPVQYNWVDQLFYVATEKLDVEYGVGTLVLDHWAFGPHHVWTDPASGYIVRMWQPFNGLEIFEPGSFHEGHDPAAFAELTSDGKTPPKAALKGGSTFHVKCTADGFPTEPQEEIPALEYRSSATESDLHRARTKVPGHDFRGDDFGKMAEKLNAHLKRMASSVRECDDWAVEELQQFQVLMLLTRDPVFDGMYHNTTDNRRIRRDVVDLKESWAKLNELARADPALARIHRDGHCHEAVMWYVHHLPQDTREALKHKITLPLLSYHRHTPRNKDENTLAIHKAYEEKVTCFSCHSNPSAKLETPSIVV